MSGHWIGVDWGTTNLRAWIFDDNNTPCASFTSEQGASLLTGAEFESVLLSLIGEQLPAQPQVDVFCCGMVGSRQGWVEADYRMVPTGLLPDPSQLKTFDAASGRLKVHIVPGVAQCSPSDVMRGEETQIAGFFAATQRSDTALCLPGTHSKWVRADSGGIKHFKTYPTGELFALLSTQSILRHSMKEGPADSSSFSAAVQESMEFPERFLSELFPIRAVELLGSSAGVSGRDRLSGLLIGLELVNARDFLDGRPVAVIGADTLSELYRSALAIAGIDAELLDGGEMVRTGLIATRQHYKGKQT